jgi:hypothetical protein
MPTGYSRSPKLLKGAIIQFSAPLFVPIPNIIIFQYNPETMSRSLTPWAPPPGGKNLTPEEEDKVNKKIAEELSQPYDPDETFSLALELDAADALEQPASHPVAVISGVADRIAALEMLMYPPDSSTLGGLLGGTLSVSASGIGLTTTGSAQLIKDHKKVPIVLFFWGPGRIVPVRITSFSVDEQAYSPTLYPLRAKVTVGLKVLDPAVLTDDGTAVYKIAKFCYKFTRAQKEALALANVANSVESIMGMLPF